jgi:plasmid stabilization system protein ParE
VTRYRVSRDAEFDLDEIFLYWAQRASLEAAYRLIDSITDRFGLLGEYAYAGKPLDEIVAGVKCFPAGIYYQRAGRGIEILDIHGARDQKRAFKKAARHE